MPIRLPGHGNDCDPDHGIVLQAHPVDSLPVADNNPARQPPQQPGHQEEEEDAVGLPPHEAGTLGPQIGRLN